MEEAKEKLIYATAPIGKLIAKFAVPCVISLVTSALYNIVDQIFIGHGVGYLGNGATTVVYPFTVFALAIALLAGDGGAAFLSLRLGEGKREAASKGVGNMITSLVIMAAIMLVGGLALLKPLAPVLGATDELMPYVFDYGYIIIIGLPFQIIVTGISAFIRADGSPGYSMAATLAGAVANIILDPIFIFVFRMGVKGAAIATVIGQLLSFAMVIYYVARKCKSVTLSLHCLKLQAKTVGSILRLGLSSFINQFAIVVIVVLSNNILVQFGAISKYGAEIPLAAMGIVMKVNQILVSILVGIAAGSQPIVGYNYGAGNLQRVKKVYFTAVKVALVVGAVAFCLFEFCPQVIVTIFGNEGPLYNEFAVLVFRTYLLLCIPTSFQTVTGIFFQSIGKPIQSAVTSLSRQILFLVPALLILPGFLGVYGALWAGPVADGLAFVLALILILVEMKKLNLQLAKKP